jgi:hypothetical protein
MYYTYTSTSSDDKQKTKEIALKSLEHYFTAERKLLTKEAQPN